MITLPSLSDAKGPKNDDFAETQAIPYTGTALSFMGNTTNTSREVGEPIHGALNTSDRPAVASEWYSITVTEAQRIEVVIDFEGVSSGLDSVVAVYTGGDVQNLTQLSRYSGIQSTPLRTH